MITSFRSKALQRLASRGDPSRLSVQNSARVRRILLLLDAARAPEDMNSPGLHLHKLSGNQDGRYAVSVTGNWRITFGWRDADAIDVDLEDYH